MLLNKSLKDSMKRGIVCIAACIITSVCEVRSTCEILRILYRKNGKNMRTYIYFHFLLKIRYGF